MTPENSIDNLREKIEPIRFCMMTTISSGASGPNLISRPMIQQALDDDGTLWFFTSDNHQLANDIDHHPIINAAFNEPDDNLYISVSGTAELVKDRTLFKKLWTPEAASWYSFGLDDPHLALLKMNVYHAELWDAAQNKMMPLFSAVENTHSNDIADQVRSHNLN